MDSDEITIMDSGDKNNNRLFQLLKDKFNFNSIVHLFGVFSVQTEHVIGMLFKGQVDLAIPSFRWANERYGVFEQTMHTYHKIN